MSSSTPKIREFLVIVPDKPGVKDKRLEVRPYVHSKLSFQFARMAACLI